MAEGTHFRPDADMADVASKLVARNLSDLAAKGAEPIGVLLSYALGKGNLEFLRGLHDALDEYSTKLLGGDTFKAQGARVFGMTAIGRATHTPVPSRSGAKAGDAVYVTGTLGRAMLGFEGDPSHRATFARPRPLLREGQALAPHVTAMMDVSDGLLLDCWRMASASKVTFEISTALAPVANNSRRSECIRWGDDYELLFTADPNVAIPVAASRIGTVTGDVSAALLLDGTAVESAQGLGYSHAD